MLALALIWGRSQVGLLGNGYAGATGFLILFLGGKDASTSKYPHCTSWSAYLKILVCSF